jgi:hypothetical protein
MQLTKEQHDILIDWVSQNLKPTKSINRNVDTSHIRHTFVKLYDKGFYIDNDTLNNVMLECGYRAANFASDPYLQFNVSQESQAIRIYFSNLGAPSKVQKCE